MVTKTDLINKFQTDDAGGFPFYKDSRRPDFIVFTDIDGTLTNGTLMIIDGQKIGNEYSVKDGHGVQMLQQSNILVVFVTKKAKYTNRNHRQRARLLEVPYYESLNKAEFVDEFVKFACMHFGCNKIEFAAIGDDLHDLGMLQKASICGCPYNAHDNVLHYVMSQQTGIAVPKMHEPGISCFRYFAEQVLGTVASWKQTGRL